MDADPLTSFVKLISLRALGLAIDLVTEGPYLLGILECDLLHTIALSVLNLEPLDIADNLVLFTVAVLETDFD